MYVHLTTHSAFSLQEGLLPPAELVRAAQADGMPALGLTDHRLLSGSIEFALACQKAGIQPVLGLEIDLENNSRLALLATNLTGWSNLSRLSSSLALRDDPEADCPLDWLATYSEGLIALGDSHNSSGEDGLQQLKDVFSDRFYIALQDPATGMSVSSLARRIRIPLVVTHPVYYSTPDQAGLQRTLTAIRLNRPIQSVPLEAVAPQDAFFMHATEMERRFHGFRAALAATAEIAERCKFDLPLGIAHMPTVPLPPGVTASEHLRKRAEQGAVQLYGHIH
jgi:DNA polymerase III subunit alpha